MLVNKVIELFYLLYSHIFNIVVAKINIYDYTVAYFVRDTVICSVGKEIDKISILLHGRLNIGGLL